MNYLLLLLTSLTISLAPNLGIGQAFKPIDLVNQHRTLDLNNTITPFERVASQTTEARKELSQFVEFKLDNSSLQRITNEENKFLTLRLPLDATENVDLELVEVDIYQGNSHIITYPENKVVNVQIGKHYRGIVKGDEKSVAAISIFDGEISGLIVKENSPTIVVGKLENSNHHIAYADNQIAENFTLSCAVADDGVNYTRSELENHSANQQLNQKCVRLYMEVDYNIYKGKGSSVQTTTNYITGLMNQVIAMYARESIKTSLSPLKIWTRTSPYGGGSSGTLLNQFQSRTNSIDGNLGQLVSYSASGGIAAGFNGLCTSYVSNKLSFSQIGSTYKTIPTYSYSVMVITHEFGHLFGSRHTHACVWNGNGTAIDSCAGYVEGSCSKPGLPNGGGFIMSYCANTYVGTNFNKGFGSQSGNVIRNRVASCVTTTCDGDSDPSDPPTDDSDRTPPSAPQNLRVTNTATTFVNIQWNASSDNKGVAKYHVFVNGNYKGYTQNTAAKIEDLQPNTTYSFHVIALDAAGNKSQKSNTVSATTKPSGGNSSCSNGEGKVGLRLTTDRYGNEVSWAIYNSANKLVGYGYRYGNSQTYNYSKCLPAGCYKFIIQDRYGDGICCNYGNGSFTLYADGKAVGSGSSFGYTYSKNFCIGKESDTEPPSIPMNVKTTKVTQTSIAITWDPSKDNVGVTGYEIFVNGKTVGQSKTPDYTIKGLKPNTKYAISVLAYDKEKNKSKSSKAISVSTLAEDKPGTACKLNKVIIRLRTDGYGTETSWIVTDKGGKVVAGGNGFESNKDYTFTYCLPAGCYKFSIADAYNDGICCKYGNGSYSVEVNGKVVASGGEFKKADVKDFCIKGEGTGIDDDNSTAQYCESKGENANYEWIDYVELGGMKNISDSNNGYGNFADRVANANIGENIIKFSAGFVNNNTYLEYWTVFIDFNQNGQFEENELVVNTVEKSREIKAMTFSVPENAKQGNTRMRVCMKYQQDTSACGETKYGETEDYTVNITQGETTTRTNTFASIEISPNPVLGNQFVINTSGFEVGNYTLTNSFGNVVANGTIQKTSKWVDVSNYPSGIYILKLENIDSVITKKIVIQ